MMDFDNRSGSKLWTSEATHGQQVAQTQMRPIGNGQVQVINPRTGQVLYTGSAAGAANSNANNGGMKKVID